MLLAHKRFLSLLALLSFFSLASGMDESHKMREMLVALMKMSIKQKVPTSEALKVEMGADAAACGDLESLRHFIDSSNVNNLTDRKLRVFQYAITFADKCRDETKYVPIFEYLFSQNAEVQKDVPGEKMSPISFATSIACHTGYLRPVEILLDKKAKAFESTSEGGTCPASIAAVATTNKCDTPHASSVLKIFQNKASTLYQAVQCLDVTKVKEFANPDSIKNSENCALVLSSEHWAHGIPQGLTILEILLSQGATPDQQLKGEMPGITLLTHATRCALNTGNSKLLEVCLAKGGNPKYKAFPMAPSAIEMVKALSLIEPKNPHIPKVKALLNTGA